VEWYIRRMIFNCRSFFVNKISNREAMRFLHEIKMSILLNGGFSSH
jgi:hypothetical protein